MEKLRMKTHDAVDGNVAKIAALFPHCVTERKGKDGNPELAIDFDKLRAELSKDVLDEGEERYQFTWPDKRAASRLANTSTTQTLRPDVKASKDFWNTENLYIEGDNLDVLKVLRENYLGKIKMIYIDPPYNTGNDFVYNDDFAQGREEFEKSSGLFDEDGNQVLDPMQRNTESNGRFHTDWLNMIYPRLKVARDLLSEDGVIFISMDDNEIENLRKLCNEIFGDSNFIASIIWQKIHSVKNDARYFSDNHEYALVYSKNIESFNIGMLPRTDSMNNRYRNPDNDPRGPWQSGDLVASGERSNGHFFVTSPKTGKKFDVPAGKHWVYSQQNLEIFISDNQIWFGHDGNSFPRKKRFLKDVKDGRVPSTIWLCEEVGHNQTATREVNAIFEGKYFDFPKPTEYIKQMLVIGSENDSIILDFFSGSATTAHAVMKLNAEDGGHRKFILIQLPEVTDEKSEARKAGYENICQIGEERIRRAGNKIREELKTSTIARKARANAKGAWGNDCDNPVSLWNDVYDDKKKAEILSESNEFERRYETLDIGFRVLRLDSSNMEEVFYTPEDFDEAHLFVGFPKNRTA